MIVDWLAVVGVVSFWWVCGVSVCGGIIGTVLRCGMNLVLLFLT